jgi:hypothetical protein
MAGILLYRGPSLLDGAPIIVIATLREGSKAKDANTKTGNMIQTTIIREDVSPVDAVRSGADSSICGSCPHRGDKATGRLRSCYVRYYTAPLSIWNAYHRGNYGDDPADLETIAAFGDGREVRLGTYGDPAAVPVHVWAALVSRATKRTGYTHQWREPSAAPLRALVMASCDRPADRAEAVAAGWRTFRVRAEEQPREPGEINCPASKEAGYRTTCQLCGLCNGVQDRPRPDVTIIAHGATAKHAAALART